MKITQIIFSPTGGTQQVTDAITAAWENHINKVDLSAPGNDYSVLNFSKDDDIVVIAAISAIAEQKYKMCGQ